MDARIAKYAGERCCVCNKYGAQPEFDQGDVAVLRAHAIYHHLTLKGPEHNAIHPKCLKQLKGLVAHATRIQT